jgi:hypothetical protein
MDETDVIRKRTHVWPVVVAIIVLGIVIAYAFFSLNGGVRADPEPTVWNGQMRWVTPA